MKKNSILCGILFLSFSITYGQINKGTFLIGGQFSTSNTDYSYNNGTPTEYASSKSSNISISIGKAFKENTVYGISLGYAPNSNDNSDYEPNCYTEKQKTYTVGVYYRKYKRLLKPLYLFNEASVGFSYTHNKITDTAYSTPYIANAYGGNLSFSPGIAYRVFKRIDLELSIPSLVKLSYSNTKSNDPYVDNVMDFTTTKSSSFGLSTNLSLSSLAFGVKILL